MAAATLAERREKPPVHRATQALARQPELGALEEAQRDALLVVGLGATKSARDGDGRAVAEPPLAQHLGHVGGGRGCV
eukprot:2301869-Pyramimonas_sp.AAC.1